MEDDALNLLIKHLEDDKQSVVLAMTKGAAKDFAEYRELCGQVRAYGASQERIRDMIKRLQQSDD